jgi:hypothetical protein
MAIAPLVGRFQKRVVRDVTGSIVLGTIGAFSFWHFVHLPKINMWKEYDLKVKAEMDLENKPYFDALAKINK